MEGVRVLKFGGAALRDGAAILRSCERVLSHGGNRPIVVVSAFFGVTDQLLEACDRALAGDPDGQALRLRHRTICRQLGLPSEVLDRLWAEMQGLLRIIAAEQRLIPEIRDRVLSFGERASARVVAQALSQAGVPATPVDAFDLGFETDGEPGGSRLAQGAEQRIGPALAGVPGVPIVTGFLAKDPLGNLTTLGRDGSDWTAAIVAEAVGAEQLIFWKDVPGILSADPRIVPEAHPLARVSVAEARELAFQGAQVLHPASLDSFLHDGPRVRVLSFVDESAPGSELCESIPRAGAVAVTSRARLVGVRFAGESPARMQSKLSAALVRLSSARLLARMVHQGGDSVRLWFEDGPLTEEVLAQFPPFAEVDRSLGSAAVVGENLGEHPELARRCWRGLEELGIPVHQIQGGTRSHGIAFLLPREHVAAAVRHLHQHVVGVPLTVSSQP
ncbi:MAG: aspartate kinase [Planctomycetota bacterium]